MWNLVSVHLETLLTSVQDRCTVYAKRTIGSEIVFTNPMVLLGDEAQLEAYVVHLQMVLILTQDRCTICDEHTIGSEIVFHTLDGTPR
jgi:hypothetical protein